jgi:hypothetical protein
MPRKVFTAGEVLAAADVNEFLMDQVVQSFAGTAARGSAIPSPVEGMYTHLEDTDDLQFWNGSAWRSPFGSTLLASESFTGTNTVIVNDVFSSQFDAYEIILRLTSSNVLDASFVLRVAGTNSTANYTDQLISASAASVTTTAGSGSSVRIGRVGSSGGLYKLLVSNPFLTTRTLMSTSSIDSDTVLQLAGSQHSLTNSYTGFQVNVSNSTGNIQVYGLRK